jgi:hypothetical protein
MESPHASCGPSRHVGREITALAGRTGVRAPPPRASSACRHARRLYFVSNENREKPLFKRLNTNTDPPRRRPAHHIVREDHDGRENANPESRGAVEGNTPAHLPAGPERGPRRIGAAFATRAHQIGVGTGLSLCFKAFSDASRFRPRITSGTGFRSKTLQRIRPTPLFEKKTC